MEDNNSLLNFLAILMAVMALVFALWSKRKQATTNYGITEGKTIKGGVNLYNPDSTRPAPPRGQRVTTTLDVALIVPRNQWSFSRDVVEFSPAIQAEVDRASVVFLDDSSRLILYKGLKVWDYYTTISKIFGIKVTRHG